MDGCRPARRLIAGTVITALAVLSVPAAAGGNPAARAGLSAAQVERLRSLDMPIAVPADVPEPFEVISVETDAGAASGWPPPHYRIVYATGGVSCFRVESASGGVGGPVPDSRWAVYPFAFLPPGDSPWYVYFTHHTARLPFFPYLVFSDWLARGQWLYRLASGFRRMDNCGAIDPRTAARIVESLAFLDTDPALAVDAFEAYPRYRAFSFQSSAGATATQAGLEVLDALDLALAHAQRRVRIVAESSKAARLLVTQSRLRDDSVAARRYRLTLVRQGPRWILQDVAVQRHCYRAPERGWSPEPCP